MCLDPKKIKPDDIISLMEVADFLQCNRQILCRAAKQGAIPFVEYAGHGWALTGRAVKFLTKHFSPEARAARRGNQSAAAWQHILKQAAKLDPTCRKRQQQIKSQYWRAKQKKNSPRRRKRRIET